jgi:hypothetical protein
MGKMWKPSLLSSPRAPKRETLTKGHNCQALAIEIQAPQTLAPAVLAWSGADSRVEQDHALLRDSNNCTDVGGIRMRSQVKLSS